MLTEMHYSVSLLVLIDDQNTFSSARSSSNILKCIQTYENIFYSKIYKHFSSIDVVFGSSSPRSDPPMPFSTALRPVFSIRAWTSALVREDSTNTSSLLTSMLTDSISADTTVARDIFVWHAICSKCDNSIFSCIFLKMQQFQCN